MLAGSMVSGCATTATQVEVTRFHLTQPIPRGDIRIMPADPSLNDSLENKQYAAVIGQEIRTVGFRPTDAANTEQLLLFSVTRHVRAAGAPRAPVTIGIGGGTGSGGFGVGVGTSFPIGTPKARELVTYTLNLRIRRVQDNVVLWEGRATTEAVMTTAAADPRTAIARMTSAIFTDFPGESGKMIVVK
ncbi:DUF4136 domain-containing protein [Aquisediminimonas sediminicola]|uniref:DUF4136 domain-containing protein n=1 Tax=Alteraquisediminimonas sediminicola TaxID=2676787 RepID=UPI001C8EE441|nr:DUF4136 domain-containing protein [Aquisediminimonas sediminicola]